MTESELVQINHSDDYNDIEAGVTSSPNLPPEPEIGKGFLKPVPETTPVERATGGVAAVAVLLALIAMIVEGSTFVILAGILSVLVGPYAYYQQTLLTDIRTLKETKEALEGEVNRLEESNQRLSDNIDTMTSSVDRLEEIDQALKVITAAQGQSVDAFRKQVEDSKAVLKHMQSNHKSAVLQNLLTVIFRSDTDKDNTIGPVETDNLLRSLKNTAPDLTIHEDRFRDAVQGKPVSDIISVVENLVRDDVPTDSRIFEQAQ